jgi:hypothetical protein
MLSRLSLVGPVVATGLIFTVAARADDAARQAIQKALKAQLEVPAYRLKSSCLDNVKLNTHDVITEVANPDKVHTVRKWNGSVNIEAFTDGKRLLTRDGGAGEFKEQTDDPAAKIKELRDNALLGEPGKEDDVRQKGQETIKGITASVYIITSKSLTTTTTLWIDDSDNRVLKTVRKIKGEVSILKQTTRVDMDCETTYEYDPSIKIMLPSP